MPNYFMEVSEFRKDQNVVFFLKQENYELKRSIDDIKLYYEQTIEHLTNKIYELERRNVPDNERREGIPKVIHKRLEKKFIYIHPLF
jgi:hypothetical protein